MDCRFSERSTDSPGVLASITDTQEERNSSWGSTGSWAQGATLAPAPQDRACSVSRVTLLDVQGAVLDVIYSGCPWARSCLHWSPNSLLLKTISKQKVVNVRMVLITKNIYGIGNYNKREHKFSLIVIMPSSTNVLKNGRIPEIPQGMAYWMLIIVCSIYFFLPSYLLNIYYIKSCRCSSFH